MRAIVLAVLSGVLLFTGCAKHDPAADKALVRQKLYEGCKSNTAAPVAKLLEADQFDALCACAADKGAEKISADKVRELQKSGGSLEPLKATIMEAGRSCAEPIVTQDFKPIVKRACLLNVKGNPNVTSQQANDYCACTASKAAELLDAEGRRNMLMANTERDAPAESAKFEEAMEFCTRAM